MESWKSEVRSVSISCLCGSICYENTGFKDIEQDKASDIEQQLPFGDGKKINTLPQMKGGGV